MTRIAALVLAASLFACSQSLPDEANSDDIIGGVDGNATALNAIGTLGVKDESGKFQFFCSASLIGPHTVLTAKHCAIVLSGTLAGMKYVNLIPIFFAVGPDAKNPVKVVEAIAADISKVDNGGFVGLGNDVAIYQLIEDIKDVKPLKVASTALVQADMGKKFVGVGFGAQSVYEDLTGDLASTRQMGTETSRALSGKAFELMLGSFQAFYDQLVYEYGQDVVDENIDLVHQWYDQTTILPGYEAWYGHAAGDAQTCHGDSGGPVLHKATDAGNITDRKNSTAKIFGVVSGGWHSRDLTCDYGTFYAAIGPATLDLVNKGLQYKDPCGGTKYSVNGGCEGDVAKRCTGKWEGDRRLSVVDCSAVGLVCKANASGRVGCADKSATPGNTPPPPVQPPSFSSIKQQVFEVSMGLHNKAVQKLQGR